MAERWVIKIADGAPATSKELVRDAAGDDKLGDMI